MLSVNHNSTHPFVCKSLFLCCKEKILITSTNHVITWPTCQKPEVQRQWPSLRSQLLFWQNLVTWLYPESIWPCFIHRPIVRWLWVETTLEPHLETSGYFSREWKCLRWFIVSQMLQMIHKACSQRRTLWCKQTQDLFLDHLLVWLRQACLPPHSLPFFVILPVFVYHQTDIGTDCETLLYLTIAELCYCMFQVGGSCHICNYLITWLLCMSSVDWSHSRVTSPLLEPVYQCGLFAWFGLSKYLEVCSCSIVHWLTLKCFSHADITVSLFVLNPKFSQTLLVDLGRGTRFAFFNNSEARTI